MTEQLRKLPVKKLAIAAAIIGLSACVLTAFTFGGTKKEETQTVYKETAVQKGDLTVGVSETGSATIKAVTIDTEIDAKVEKVLVKAGQSVKKGDALIQLSTEDLQDELETLQLSYEKQQLSIQKAELDQKVSELEAKSTLDSSILKGETADQSYEITLDQAEYEYANAKSELSELGDTLNDYENELDDMDDTLKKYAQNADEAKAALIEALNAADSSLGLSTGSSDTDISGAYDGVTDSDLDSETIRAIKNLYSKWESAEDKYDDYNDAYDEKEESLKDKISSTKSSIKSKSLSLKSLESSMKLDETTAEADKNSSLVTAENAQTIYDTELAQNDISLKTAQLELKEIQKNIDELTPYLNGGILTATCDGLVMSLGCEEGDEVSKGTTLVTISDPQNAYATVTIDQEDIADVKLGNTANVTFSAYEELKFTGTIDSISITPARSGSSTVSYTVNVKLDGDASQIYEGMTCEITFITKEVKDVLYVSNKAIISDGGKEYVKVKGSDGAVGQVEVTTGFSDGRNVEIKSGLSDGDTALIESQVQTR